MKVKLFFISALIALFVTAACTDAAKPPVLAESPAPPAATAVKNEHQDEGHDAPRISLADAKKAYDAGATVVDVRDVTAYKTEHIKGALHIPIAEAAANESKLPKGKKIIVYCS